MKQTHNKGYYSQNKIHSEDYIARVAIVTSAIANLEGLDDKTKELLSEAVTYHASGMMLDSDKEEYKEYSAKIAGNELRQKYSQEDVGIVQAVIEATHYQIMRL